MPDHPILFSGSMVRAILEGRKTQTRRILKDQHDGMHLDRVGPTGWQFTGPGGLPRIPFAPKYAPGDRLWVRESVIKTPAGIAYAADGNNHYGAGGKLRATPSIHMPRWASRITLLVEAVKVERLQDISEADAIAEGIEPNCDLSVWRCYLPEPKSQDYWLSPVESFRTLWSSINGPDSWTANPWVAAYTFKPIFQNIDIIRKEAA